MKSDAEVLVWTSKRKRTTTGEVVPKGSVPPQSLANRIHSVALRRQLGSLYAISLT